MGSPRRKPKDKSFGAISSFWKAPVREKRNRDREGNKPMNCLSVSSEQVTIVSAGSSLMLEAL